jgi:hypothetical protein
VDSLSLTAQQQMPDREETKDESDDLPF